jgi:hypothetical protein
MRPCSKIMSKNSSIVGKELAPSLSLGKPEKSPPIHRGISHHEARPAMTWSFPNPLTHTTPNYHYDMMLAEIIQSKNFPKGKLSM